MSTLLELAQTLQTGTARVRGKSIPIRALSDRETAAIARLFPRPLPPINARNPNAGSLAAPIDNPNDPEFRQSLGTWNRERWRMEVALSAALVKLTGKDDADAAALRSAALQVSELLTEVELVAIWEEVRRLFGEQAEAKARDGLLVDLKDAAWDDLVLNGSGQPELPSNYGTTVLRLDLDICRAYGIAPWAFADAEPGWKTLLRADEVVRRQEAARRAGGAGA